MKMIDERKEEGGHERQEVLNSIRKRRDKRDFPSGTGQVLWSATKPEASHPAFNRQTLVSGRYLTFFISFNALKEMKWRALIRCISQKLLSCVS